MARMRTRSPEDSRHYDQIWKKVIRPVFKVVSDECDEEFRAKCGLTDKYPESWKKQLEAEYRNQRKNLKDCCYGNFADSGLLDGRKIAAIFCKSLILRKAFKFDLDRASALMREKEKQLSPMRFNLWTAQNVYINYKLAYYASLQLVYLTLLHDLQDSEDTRSLALELNRKGHLYPYPSPSGADSFDVNIIIGLARVDLSGRDMDPFLFAMQLYQIEMYSVEMLKKEVSEQMAQQIANDVVSTHSRAKSWEPYISLLAGQAVIQQALPVVPSLYFPIFSSISNLGNQSLSNYRFMIYPFTDKTPQDVEYPKAPPLKKQV